jgi:chromosome segregation ATPase
MRTYKTNLLCGIAIVLGMTACASQKTPATADVAVSRSAVDSATSSDAAELAPAEMQAAREKLMNANQALAAKDYKAAQMWASAAEADAKLAQSKANSAKATTAANQLQDSIRVLREELDRKPIQQ